jgi:hypothetical protein
MGRKGALNSMRLPLETFPEFPSMPLPDTVTSLPLRALIPTTYSPIIDRYTNAYEGDNNHCL